MVLPDSRKVPRAPRYLGALQASPVLFAYRTFTVSGLTFQTVWLNNGISDSPPGRQTGKGETHNTKRATPAGSHARLV